MADQGPVPGRRIPSGGVATGALARSLRTMTVGTVQAHQELRDAYAADSLGELDMQFQVPVTGEAAAKIGWVKVNVEFAAPLIAADDERQSPYSDPLFTSGFVLLTEDPVLHSVYVRRWVLDTADVDYYTGAEVRIGIWSPTPKRVPFKAEAHLNFQGYGTPNEPLTDEDENT
jgi:hypothetical protein